ncbi:MAG: nicotinate-nucleotide--dimethylbenzimidazole phosphoribosyltransferase, partial [Desulfatiglandales bacterium]
MEWKDGLKGIRPISQEWINKAWERLDNLTKPRRSLGRLEEVAAQVVGITQSLSPDLSKKKVFVFAGDHGVVEEGVSAYPREVTYLMVKNFLVGGAAINVLSRHAGAEVCVVDVGVAADLGGTPGLIHRKVNRGTKNMAKEPAMTETEASKAVQIGFELACEAKEKGVGIVATGEMGIGNT